jgi:hypothetical protein
MGWKIIVLSIFRRPGVAFRRALRHSSRVHRTKHTSVVCGLLARIVYHAGGPSFPHHRSPPEHPATRRRRNLVGPVVPSDGDRRRPGGRAAPCRALLSGFGGGTRHPDTSAGRPGRAKSESCHAESPGHCDRTCMFVPPLCRFASLIAHMIDIGIWYSVWAVQCDRFSLLGRSHLMFRFTKGTKSPTVPLDKFCTYT